MNKDRNFNNILSQPRILVAPLGWGLGHATRCIPIIHELLQQNSEVFIAAEGDVIALLSNEFPQVKFLPLSGYRIKYSRKKYFLPFMILSQIPKFVFTIYKEYTWLKKIIKEYEISAVISDNRFGMYSYRVPSVYITHQLGIKTGNIFSERIVNKIHYYFINKYRECWVPDFKSNGLAGELSHPDKLPNKIKYLGALSRFEIYYTEKKYDLLIAISGPEPQRTIFENKILDDLKSFKGKYLFIRGLPHINEELKCENPLSEIRNHLSAKKLNEAILQSDMVISRSGYTTVMDLIKLKKKAILIPTPGQTEQEYLAKYLMDNQIFYTADQKNFSLYNVLRLAETFPFKFTDYDMDQYKKIISQFVQSL